MKRLVIGKIGDEREIDEEAVVEEEAVSLVACVDDCDDDLLLFVVVVGPLVVVYSRASVFTTEPTARRTGRGPRPPAWGW